MAKNYIEKLLSVGITIHKTKALFFQKKTVLFETQTQWQIVASAAQIVLHYWTALCNAIWKQLNIPSILR